jgi:hypothetical protein
MVKHFFSNSHFIQTSIIHFMIFKINMKYSRMWVQNLTRSNVRRHDRSYMHFGLFFKPRIYRRSARNSAWGLFQLQAKYGTFVSLWEHCIHPYSGQKEEQAWLEVRKVHFYRVLARTKGLQMLQPYDSRCAVESRRRVWRVCIMILTCRIRASNGHVYTFHKWMGHICNKPKRLQL